MSTSTFIRRHGLSYIPFKHWCPSSSPPPPLPPYAHIMLRRWILQATLGAMVARAGITYTSHTVDDDDSSITYSGTWEPSSSHPSPLNYGGSHTLGVSSDARAVFTFTGVAVYYLASLWPYEVNSYVSLDGGPNVLIDMTAPPGTTAPSGVNVGDEVVNFDVRWRAEGLENTTHTLTITRGPSTYAISDGFRYTVAIEDTTSEVSTSSRTQQNLLTSTSQQAVASESLSSTSAGGLSQKNLIIIAVVCSVFGTLLLVGICCLLFTLGGRKKKNRNRVNEANERPPTYNGGAYGNNGYTPVSMATQYSPVNTVSQGHPHRPGSDWYPPGAAPPVFTPPPVSAPTPAPMYPYHDMGVHPANPTFNPQRLSQLPAAMGSVTTLPPPTPLPTMRYK